MRVRSTLVFAAALAAVTAPSLVRAGAWIPAPGEYYSEFQGARLSADTYHDSTGARQAFTLGGYLERRSLSSYNELGWKKKMSVILAAPAISSTRRLGYDRSTESQTQTGLGDLIFGLRYALKNAERALSIEVDWQTPLGYEHVKRGEYLPKLGSSGEDYGSPQLGVGTQNLDGLLWGGMTLPKLNAFFQAAGGYRYRFEEPEDQFLGLADAGIWIGPSLMLAGHYVGTFPATSAAGFDRQSTHIVGPELRYRVDERLDVFAGSRHTMWGRNVVHVDQYYIGMAFKQTRLNRLQGFLGGTRKP